MIGFSNKKEYHILEIAPWDNNIGLVEIEGWLFPVWCTFERIIMTTTEMAREIRTIANQTQELQTRITLSMDDGNYPSKNTHERYKRMLRIAKLVFDEI